MFRKNGTRRVRNLVMISALTAIILSVSTYAWFIGMRTVNVTSFDVEIKTTDSLMLSLDGATWSSDVSISELTLDDVSYVGHTNNWGKLIPVSSIGVMDVAASRMMLYEKASFTATPGGYRLLASRVDNSLGQTEKDGYVVFDLFVRNYSGTQYIEALEPLDEEAVYLTTNSNVKVADVGGVANTGIENSVRVAFAQIGRVIGTSMDAAKITGITCNDDGAGNPTIVNGVTGICRTAQIWEPNDTKHEANAIRWYDTSCLIRTADDLTLATSYGGPDPENPTHCNPVVNLTSYPTYAIMSPITSANRVDVYDGPAYNTYADTTELQSYDYFRDTDKIKTSTLRPPFMYLSPNSVTKIRVYIYIEGQDIDNYDFSSIGKKISVNFGLTKERFTETDIAYNGPDVTHPVITMLGANPMVITQGDPFVDPGTLATDNRDGVITPSVVVGGVAGVDTDTVGTYFVTYNVADAAGNTANQARRTILVVAP